jgi:undecaprenyl diphosphate synthase
MKVGLRRNSMDQAPAQTMALSPQATHVGIIMDGNGRWATELGMHRTAGHVFGAERLWPVIDEALAARVRFLTVFAFSVDNWKRDTFEVDAIMTVIRWTVLRKIQAYHAKGVQFRWMGFRSNLPLKLIQTLDEAENLTRSNREIIVTLCIDHSGRAEIVRAVQAIAIKVQNGQFGTRAIAEEQIDAHMQWPDMPRVDILIRTSGEQRISNFLIWQASDARLVFVKKKWPDFTPQDFREALATSTSVRLDHA